jgi:MtrB/PioB family decaheme-associated outer membrane protein
MKQMVHHGVRSLIAYLLIHAMFFTPGAQAAGTTLRNVREGLHAGYTRLVLDCQGAAPEAMGPARPQSFGIRFADLAVRADLNGISRRLRGMVRQIDLLNAKSAYEIRLSFQSPGLGVKTLLMKSDTASNGRYRLVIDVFPKPNHTVEENSKTAAGAALSAPAPGPPPTSRVPNQSTAVAAAASVPVVKPAEKAMAVAPEPAAKPAAMTAETPPATKSTGQETPAWTYSGEVGLILAAANGEDDSSKFEEYRDISQPVAGEVSIAAESDRGRYVRGSAVNVGRDDPSVDAAAGRYGRYDLDFKYNRLIHRYAYEAKTLYSGVGSGAMTLDDTLQANIQAAPTSAVAADLLKDAMAVAASGDPEVTRDKAKLSLKVAALEPFNFKIEVGHETRQGTRPFAGAFSNSQMVELFEPIDYETTDLRATGEYNGKNMLLNFAYHYSQFTNAIDTLTFDNPLRVADAALAPTTGEIDLAPDNQYHNLSLNGAWTRLPGDSQITANIALGWMLQDDDLVPFTTNTAIASPALPAKSADAKVNTSLYDLRLTSHPLPYMHVKANLRYYDYDNRTGRIDFTGGYVDTDAVVINNPITNLPTSYTKTRAGLDLDFDVLARTRLGLGYQFERTDRKNREVDQQDDNTIKTSLDSRPLDWMDIRATYQRTDRQIGDYNTDVYLLSGSDIGELPQVRKYDQADMVRDRYSVSASVYPVAAWTLTGTFTYGKDDFEDSPYGLLQDDHTIASIDTDYAINDRATVNLFYTYEEYKNSQRGSDTGTDWTGSGEDLINTVGGGMTLALIPRRLDFNLTYSYSAADGDIAFTSPAGSFADFKAVDDAQIHTLNSKLSYRLSKHLALSLGYLWEKFDYKDYNTNGFAYVPTDAAGNYQGALLAGTLPKDYDAQVVYTQLTFRFK